MIIAKKSYRTSILVIIGLMMCLLSAVIIQPVEVFGEPGNIFVEDNAGILSASDKEYIQHINEDIFNDLPGKPQYAVVTLNSLDGYGSIEDYAEKTFKKLGIGQKSLDNGFLFVISVNDREYRLETGYGVEDVITDSMKEDVVTDEATDLLRNENYGGAVMVISNNIEKLVTNRYGDYEVSKQAIIDERERTARFLTLFAYFIIGIMLLIVMLIVLYKNKLNRLAKRLEKDYIS
ncbi:MAG: TPM domain-containing protein, partial [Vagococcus sp.]